MSLSDGRRARALDRAVELGVPAGLAALTWLGLALAAGFLARLNDLSVLNLLPLFFVGLLFWPVYSAAPWRPGVAERARSWARRSRAELAVVAVLWLVPLAPLVPELVVSLLQLPYRGSGIFFGASLFYRQRLGPEAGRLLLAAAQAYIQLLWLFLLSKGLVAVGRRLR